MLRLSLFGAPGLRRSGEDPSFSILAGPKRLALLTYLALQGPDARCRRDTLLALFWPEADSTSARRSLRNMLYELRQALGDGVLSGRRREELALDAEKIWCDVWAFEDALERSAWEEALELYRGELLTGFHVAGVSAELEQWLDQKRAEFHRRAVAAAWRLSEGAEGRGRADEAIRWARRAVGLGPKDGQSGRGLIELLARLDRPVAALRAFETLTRQLRDDLGVDPPEELRDRMDELRATLAATGSRPESSEAPAFAEVARVPGNDRPTPGSPETPTRSPPFPRSPAANAVLLLVLGLAAASLWYWSGRSGTEANAAVTGSLGGDDSPPTIAVLPFQDVGPDSVDYFAAGLHEEVLTRLAKVSDLRVLSGTSVRQYQNTRKTVREIGRELGVSAILEGSVRRAGDRVRITVQLLDARAGVHLWAEDFDRTLSVSALLDIQTALATEISDALEAELEPDERERIARVPTEDLAAYNAYLEGRYHLGRLIGVRTYSSLGPSLAALREAVRLDPEFAEAHAWLAVAHAVRSWVPGQPNWVDSAHHHLERSMALDPELASLYLAEAIIHFATRSSGEAEAALRETLRLEPSNVMAHSLLASVKNIQGEPVGAVEAAYRSVQLDPRSPMALQGMGFMLKSVGLRDASLAWYRRALGIDPDYMVAVWNLADLYRADGQPQKALRALEAFIQRYPEHHTALRLAGRTALDAGRPRLARHYLQRGTDARRRTLSVGPSLQGRFSGQSLEDFILIGVADIRSGDEIRGRALLREVSDTLRRRLRHNTSDSGDDRRNLARALAALGETEAALDHFQLWARGRTFNPDRYRVDPSLANLQGTIEFRRLLERRERELEPVRDSVRALDIDLYPPPTAIAGRMDEQR